MSNQWTGEDLRKIADQLQSILEADKPKDGETATDSTDDAAVDDTADEDTTNDIKDPDQSSVDKDVTDVMTKEKEPEKLTGSVSVNTLASDLGIKNLSMFTKAFNSLRQGQMPRDPKQVRELAIAFDRMLAADASTTSRVLTRLRQIHKIKDTPASA
jgi:hypothetical protein